MLAVGVRSICPIQWRSTVRARLTTSGKTVNWQLPLPLVGINNADTALHTAESPQRGTILRKKGKRLILADEDQIACEVETFVGVNVAHSACLLAATRSRHGHVDGYHLRKTKYN
jgi:hypothetical protein